MRSGVLALRAAGAAVILVAVPVHGATAARADDGVTATVSPVVIAAQGQVQVRVEGCRGGRATVSSRAFAGVAVLSGSGSRGAMYGDVPIKSAMAAGSYRISVNCDGHDHGNVGRFDVVDGGRGHHAGATPHAPVQAGGGGTALHRTGAQVDTDPQAKTGAAAAAVAEAGGTPQAAAPAEQSGPGVPYTLAGLVLAGVAAVAVAYRSTQRRRATAASADRDAD